MTSFLPVAKGEEAILGEGAKVLNAAEFSSLYKGTGVNAGTPGIIRAYNYMIRQNKSIITTLGTISTVADKAQTAADSYHKQ